MWTAYDKNGRPLTTISRGFTSQRFTANGTYTTPALCKALIVEAVAAGGAGGGANVATVANVSISGGGGSGAYGRIYIPTPNATYAVVVGIGGLGAASVVGPNGSNTTFGSTILVCQGGLGGNGAIQNALTQLTVAGGGAAPVATTTATALVLTGGNPGQIGYRIGANNTMNWSGAGADSPLGSGGTAGVAVSTVAGGAGIGFGSGGGGGLSNTAATAAGGSGAPGVLIVYEFY